MSERQGQPAYGTYVLDDGVLSTQDLDLAAYLIGEYDLPLRPITYQQTRTEPNRPGLPPPAIATFTFDVEDPATIVIAADDFINGEARGNVKKCFIVRTSLLKRLRYRMP